MLNVIIIYYRVLAWISILTTITSLAVAYWFDYLHLDLSFLIWFLIANKLSQKSKTTRNWCLFLSSFAIIISGIVFVSAINGANMQSNFGPFVFYPNSVWFYVINITLTLIFAFPLALLHPSAKREFSTELQPHGN